MKAMKVVLKVLVCLVALVGVALLSLPLWFGPVVKTVANAVAPGIVKTDFRLGHLSLNPYTARFELGSLSLGNPPGYSVAEAVRVGSVVVDAETFSLATDVIHVEEVSLKDLFVSVVSGGENKVLNFKQIQYNVAGGKEKYEAAQVEKEAKAAVATDNPPPAEKGADAEKPAKKIIIDRLEVSGLKVHLGFLPIRVPSVVLKDIGRKTGGATLEDAWQQILDGVMKAAGVTGDQLKSLGAFSGDAAKKATEKASAAVQSASAAANSAMQGASGTVNGGVKAAGEGVKKAMDSLKSLW